MQRLTGMRARGIRARRAAAWPLFVLWVVASCGGGDSAPAPPPTAASVEVTPALGSIEEGATLQLGATPRDAKGNALSRPVTWSAAPTTVASVSTTGLVTGVSAGSATVTAAADGATGSATVTVLPAAVASVSVTLSSPTLEVGQGAQAVVALRDTRSDLLSGRTVAWSTSNAAVATVGTAGLVTGVAPGQVTITAIAEGKSGTVVVTVVQAAVAAVTVSVTLSTIEVRQGTPASAVLRDARGTELTGRGVTWTTSNATVASVSSAGVVTGASPGTVTITASAEGKSGNAALSVVPASVATVQVTLTPSSVSAGQTTQAIATLRDQSGALLTGVSVQWSSSNVAIATVATTGRVLALVAGQATITASAGGRSALVTLVVNTPPADGRAAVLASMSAFLPNYITTAVTYNQGLLPNNPAIASYIQAKITMLQTPGLANSIISGNRTATSVVTSSNGRQLPIVAIFPLESMRTEAAEVVAAIQLALPILESFFALPFPAPSEQVWYGFVMGNTGGGGAMYMEDRGTYEIRVLPPRFVEYEPIVMHELSHTYILNESLNQFLELLTYNMVRNGSAAVADWIHARQHQPFASSNGGVHALLDIYQLIGYDAMAKAYRAVYPLRPLYGVALSDAVKQAFIDQAPAALKAQVSALIAKVTS